MKKNHAPLRVRPHAETAVEILVQRHHAHAVEQRYEHEGYDQITYDESTYHLHVGEAVGCYRAGHRYERHARYGRSDHSQAPPLPQWVRLPPVETRVVCTPRCASPPRIKQRYMRLPLSLPLPGLISVSIFSFQILFGQIYDSGAKANSLAFCPAGSIFEYV